MNLIEVAKDVFIDPNEVASVEYDATYKWSGSWSGGCNIKDFEGSRVTMKNGRKIFIKDVSPHTVMVRLKKESE